jgi:HEPN domain-containing protein
MSEIEKIVSKWLKKADEDLATVRKLSEKEEDFIFFKSTILFHCQQAIEKYLKAFLIYKNVEFPKTHHLEFLNDFCIELGGVDFEKLEFGGLSGFAVDSRYPDKYEEQTPDELKSYLQLVTEVKSLVESKIKFQGI